MFGFRSIESQITFPFIIIFIFRFFRGFLKKGIICCFQNYINENERNIGFHLNYFPLLNPFSFSFVICWWNNYTNLRINQSCNISITFDKIKKFHLQIIKIRCPELVIVGCRFCIIFIYLIFRFWVNRVECRWKSSV